MKRFIITVILFFVALLSISQKPKNDTLKDFFNQATKIEDSFGSITTTEIQGKGIFSPKDYEYVIGASPFDDPETLKQANANNQPFSDKIIRAFKRCNSDKLWLMIGFIILAVMIFSFIYRNNSKKNYNG